MPASSESYLEIDVVIDLEGYPDSGDGADDAADDAARREKAGMPQRRDITADRAKDKDAGVQ